MESENWNKMYKLAKQYFEENGNLVISNTSKMDNKQELRKWLITQRRSYKLKHLSKEKVDLLNEIGMIWSQYDFQWNEYYNLLKNYYNVNGNSLVPLRYVTEDNKKLGNWVSKQRINYKTNKMSQEKVDLLEKVDMVWNPADLIWNETYKIAKQYYDENNNLNIPNEFFYKNVSLGSWILTQRNNFHENLLTDSQIKMLDEIGMEWDSIRNKEYIWDKNYNTVLEFYNKYKHLYIPTNYYSKDGVNIGRWLYDQKLKYKKNELDEYRRNKLDLLDKSWKEPSNTKSSFPEQAVLYYIKKNFPSATKLRTEEISEIDIYIPELKIGIEYDGPTHIRSTKKDIEKSNACKKVGIRLIRIRDIKCPIINDESYKIILKNDSFESLDNGIHELLKYLNVYDTNVNISRDYMEISDNYIKSIDLDWYNMYEKLKEYHNEYGNINVPIYYKTSDGFLLGHWLSNIRSSMKNPSMNGMRLNTNKIELLNKLGMNWSPIESQWKTKYNLAKEYHNENGNLLIPDKYVTSDGTKLGRWISTQRNYYKKGKLPEDKIDLLEKIDMVWSLK